MAIVKFNMKEVQLLVDELNKTKSYSPTMDDLFKPALYKTGKVVDSNGNDEEHKEFALLNRAKRIIKKRLKTGRVKPEQTEHGSIIERSHFPLGDTLTFWNCYLNDSWRIAHQDSSYSAFWYNERELKLCTYCEGDVVFMTAPNEEIYRKDYESLDAWYTDNL
ncbi:hypothetical protein ACJO10_21265 [Vibrio parahaemolyticus]|uniref:hypothetical protein n=1 Tax=Vibrio parahaemolyticus TaxID=670 RepID=UPI00387B5609